eukprot:559754-Amphidinium_carterae.2
MVSKYVILKNVRRYFPDKLAVGFGSCFSYLDNKKVGTYVAECVRPDGMASHPSLKKIADHCVCVVCTTLHLNGTMPLRIHEVAAVEVVVSLNAWSVPGRRRAAYSLTTPQELRRR